MPQGSLRSQRALLASYHVYREVLLDSVEAYQCIPGSSDYVNITNTTLSIARKWLAAAAGPDRIVFAGGLYVFSRCVVVLVGHI